MQFAYHIRAELRKATQIPDRIQPAFQPHARAEPRRAPDEEERGGGRPDPPARHQGSAKGTAFGDPQRVLSASSTKAAGASRGSRRARVQSQPCDDASPDVSSPMICRGTRAEEPANHGLAVGRGRSIARATGPRGVVPAAGTMRAALARQAPLDIRLLRDAVTQTSRAAAMSGAPSRAASVATQTAPTTKKRKTFTHEHPSSGAHGELRELVWSGAMATPSHDSPHPTSANAGTRAIARGVPRRGVGRTTE